MNPCASATKQPVAASKLASATSTDNDRVEATGPRAFAPRQRVPSGRSACRRRHTRALLIVGAAFLSLLPLVHDAAAQVGFCGTVVGDTGGDKLASDCPSGSTNPLIVSLYPAISRTIPVVFVVVSNIQHDGDLSDQTILDQIAALNDAYGGATCPPGHTCPNTAIHFVLQEIVRLTDDTLFEVVRKSSAETTVKYTLGRDPRLYLNVYSAHATDEDSATIHAWSTVPWTSEALTPLDGIVIDYSLVGGASSSAKGRILAHEVGHSLGLYHTWESTDDAACLARNPNECFSNGDRICDTNPERTFEVARCRAEASCPSDDCDPSSLISGCNQQESCYSCGDPNYPDPIHNFMTVRSGQCMYEFTAQQIGRMQCAFLTYRPLLGTAPLFVDSPAAVKDTGTGEGASWGDYDADGDDDLYLVNLGANRLYRNDGADVFTDVTSGGFGDAGDGSSGTWGDYNADGNLDLFVSNGTAPDRLLRSDGLGGFLDVSASMFEVQGFTGYGAAWADYDRDGDLDLYIAGSPYGRLFRNDGLSIFTNVTDTAGDLSLATEGRAPAWSDWDGDGDLDLFVASSDVHGRGFFRNNGNGTFTNLSTAPAMQAPHARGAAWGDFDGDQDLDLYVVCNATFHNVLFRNDGGGAFTKVFTNGPIANAGDGRGCAWGDFDNDGDLDLYLVNWGIAGPSAQGLDHLFRNDGAQGFTDWLSAWDPGKGTALAAADYDRDGDLDLYLVKEDEANRLLRNQTIVGTTTPVGRNWVEVVLVGTVSNRAAIGARVKVVTGAQTQVREISGGGGYYSQDSQRAHFGLGNTTTVDELEVHWPSGRVTTRTAIAANQVITEFESAAVFENRSTESGITYSGGYPYSSVAFDYDGDGKQDLMVSMRNDHVGELFRNTGNLPSGVPRFVPVTSDVFQPGPPPDFRTRGLSVADYDNDGDLDLFAAHESTPRLYRNDPNGTARSFVDVSGSLGLSTAALQSWAGAWGDYDRDGWVDLYVVRASGTPPAGPGGVPVSPDPTWIAGRGAQDRLLRSTLSTGGGFADVTQQAGLHLDASETIGASWADIDGDKDLDLFVAWLGPPNAALPFDWSPLYINQGNGTFVDASGAATVPRIGKLRYVSGAAWADFNRDGVLDIGLIRQKSGPPDPQSNGFIYLNDGHGDLTTEPPYGVNALEPMQGLALQDFDLNGSADFLTVPAAAQGPVRLYLGFAPPTGIKYLEQGAFVGLTAGKADGIAAADFSSDGDVDVFVGRPDSSSTYPFYFQNKATSTSDGPKNNWIGIKLQATAGGNNRAGIGATVKVQVPPSGTPILVQARTVDGGMGRGSQSPLVHLFGLGQLTSDIKVTTTWPDAYVQDTTLTYNSNPALNQLNHVQTVVERAHAPAIVPSTLAFISQPKPNLVSDWVISFKTNYNAAPTSLEVTVENSTNPPPAQCYSIETTVLKAGVAGVACSVKPVAGGYLCEIRWSDVPCTTVCNYRAKNPKCALGSKVSTSTDSKGLKQSVCAQ